MFGNEVPEFLAPIVVALMFSFFFMIVPWVFVFFIPSRLEKESEQCEKHIQISKKKLAEFDREQKDTTISNRQIDSQLPIMVQKQSYLEDRINQISYHLDESRKVRDVIYGEDILPMKYRNIVSVASLYQFLVNGICTQVKGHGGIYDTYEYHLKLKEIIDNLSEIRKDLRSIRNNQEFLHDKLCDVQETLNDINAGISSTMKEVSSNTAMAAEAAKRTAIASEWRNRDLR